MENNQVLDAKIEKVLRSAKSSLEVEGFTVSPEWEKLLTSKLKGEISEEEYKQRLEKL